MNMLDLVLSLAFLGVADDAPPMPAAATPHLAIAKPLEQPQGIKDWWPWSQRSHRDNLSPGLSQSLRHECNTPAPGPLPLVLLGVGVCGVGAAARSRRRKRRAAARALSSRVIDR